VIFDQEPAIAKRLLETMASRLQRSERSLSH
jgi:CRP-like cAMP-binding protein